MASIPRKTVARTARLASLPLGMAGRATIGLGRRIGGASAESVADQVQEQTAQQLFKVLGELKGGAMKFGQALSIFESALPENLAAPYRATLDPAAGLGAADAAPRRCTRCFDVSSARAGGACSRRSTTTRRLRRPSGRCTERCGRTVATSR